jgi:CLIP-associating protein 1/2
MHQEQGLQFRGYVPLLMDLLEDADGMVRDVAKSTVIELFRYELTCTRPWRDFCS